MALARALKHGGRAARWCGFAAFWRRLARAFFGCGMQTAHFRTWGNGMDRTVAVEGLDDVALLTGLREVVEGARLQLVELLRRIGEVEVRRLFAAQGYGSIVGTCIAERRCE